MVMAFRLDDSAIGGASVREPISHLCKALGRTGSIKLQAEFTEGFSNTRVFLAEERKSPEDCQPSSLVFKVGPGDVLRDEVRRYGAFIPHARAPSTFAKMLSSEETLKTLPKDSSPGAIAYEHAASALAQTSARSLKSLFREYLCGATSAEELAPIVSTTLRALSSLYAKPESEFAFTVAEFYLQRWVPDFQVTVETATSVSGACLLTMHGSNAKHFPNVKATPTKELRDRAESPPWPSRPEIVLRTVKLLLVGNRGYTTDPSSQELTLHVGVDRLPPNERQKLTKSSHTGLWAPAGPSRYETYRERVTAAFPGVDVEAPVIQVGSLRLHNPLRHLSRPLLEQTREPAVSRMAPAHGDLHPGNVLVVGTTPVIIDYGLAEEKAPIGVDAGRLFGGLVRDVASEVLPPEEIAALLADVLGLEPAGESEHEQAIRARSLLRTLAREAASLGGDDPDPLWPLHLYGYGLIALKWSGSPAEHQASFLIAAVALTKLLGPPPEEVKPAPLAGPMPTPAPLARITPEGRKIKSERAAEILVLVATFASTASFDPTTRIYRALADHVFELVPKLVRVERIDEVVSARKEASDLAKRYKASMIVWGTADGLGVSPLYDLTRKSLVQKRSALQLDEVTRCRLGEKFEPYITTDMASEISFLSLFAIGQMCEFNLNLTQAIAIFERATTLIPNVERAKELGLADLYYRLANVLCMMRQYERALVINEKGRKLAPCGVWFDFQRLEITALSSNQCGVNEIRMVKERLQRLLSEAGVDREAIEETLESLKWVKTFTDLRKEKASRFRNRLMIPIDRAQVRRYSKDVVHHLEQASRFCEQNKFDKGLNSIRKALRLNPRCAQAYLIQGNILAVTDKVPDALRAVHRAETLDASFPLIHSLKARIYLDSGIKSAKSALESIEKAHTLGVPASDLLGEWGAILLKLGRGDEMMQMLREHATDPSKPEIFVLRSHYHRTREDYASALSEAEQALDLAKVAGEQTPEDRSVLAGCYEERAEVYLGLGRREEALSGLRRAIEVLPPRTFYRRKLTERLIAIEGEPAHMKAPDVDQPPLAEPPT